MRRKTSRHFRKTCTAALALTAALLAAPAMAQDCACLTRVNHLDIAIAPGAIIENPDPSLRERLLSWPGNLWNRAWGQPVTCDSETTIAYLAGILALDEVDSHCLAEASDDDGSLLIPGERNFRGRCQRTICDRVNATAESGTDLARNITRLATGEDVDSLGDGITALASTSGAMLLTGRSSVIMAALGQGAEALLATFSAPTAAVTVMAVGGAVYMCRD